MPKVTRKETAAAAAAPLREVPAAPSGMEIEAGEEQLPPKPGFSALSAQEQAGNKVEFRRIPVPQHRMTPLKTAWMQLYTPITDHLKLDMRMNLKTKKVEIKTTATTRNGDMLQKAADFVHAYLLGFEVRDAIALLRLDDLYVECFEVKDVKTLRGEHLSRCIGRLAGKSGKTKFTIENATRTRIVLADTRIHILGSFQNIRVARDAICSLILGSPPGKVYSKLRSVCARLNDS
ncbi:RNA-binding protein-like [Raphidocelis subcapitata]|uniref:RNA-binding protein-like n=1 Tax=Raphidocelis subcapitata TaxID=307507 RepID=A0A2V0NV74_9CHLO|nr:RNA-binding protein-like [Raphidocelis subcapitata]|eukprot:GBF88847.1 RNA-binding protein-like [Raphidocelis subcapitata]